MSNAKETVGGGGFKCTRCGTDIGDHTNQDEHNGAKHLPIGPPSGKRPGHDLAVEDYGHDG